MKVPRVTIIALILNLILLALILQSTLYIVDVITPYFLQWEVTPTRIRVWGESEKAVIALGCSNYIFWLTLLMMILNIAIIGYLEGKVRKQTS